MNENSSLPPLSDAPVGCERGGTETGAAKLLREHLARGSRARRQAAAFALALTQAEAVVAIAAFFGRNEK